MHMPRKYLSFGRVGLGGSIVGSMLPGGNSQSSSLILTHWAGSGDNILAVNNANVRVGVV